MNLALVQVLHQHFTSGPRKEQQWLFTARASRDQDEKSRLRQDNELHVIRMRNLVIDKITSCT